MATAIFTSATALGAATGPGAVDHGYVAVRGRAAFVIAEDLGRRRDLVTLAGACGGRVVASAGAADAVEAIARQAGSYVVVADLRGIAGPVADRLLDAIARESVRADALVAIDCDAIDGAFARLDGPAIRLLVAPGEQALADAVARALEPHDPRLCDNGGERRSRRLAELSEEVGRIARTLAALSAEGAVPSPGDAREEDPAELLAAVRVMVRVRRLRGQFFEPALFADPAWDMLLDLFAARIERRRVAVSSLCIAAAVPPTTALRWIATMTESGLLRREPDPEDGRRVFVALSDAAAQAMVAYLAAMRAALRPAGPTER